MDIKDVKLKSARDAQGNGWVMLDHLGGGGGVTEGAEIFVVGPARFGKHRTLETESLMNNVSCLLPVGTREASREKAGQLIHFILLIQTEDLIL